MDGTGKTNRMAQTNQSTLGGRNAETRLPNAWERRQHRAAPTAPATQDVQQVSVWPDDGPVTPMYLGRHRTLS